MCDICKICNAVENEMIDELRNYRRKIDIGIFGQGEASIWICAHRPGKVTFEFNIRGDEGPLFNVINVPITHCPFCGKEFSKIIQRKEKR